MAFQQGILNGGSKVVDVNRLSNYGIGSENSLVEVQCFPLITLLLAANMTSVDYFSLDIEGQELNVLRSIPWDKVDIKVRSRWKGLLRLVVE